MMRCVGALDLLSQIRSYSDLANVALHGHKECKCSCEGYVGRCLLILFKY